jgi:hypothetical protein
MRGAGSNLRHAARGIGMSGESWPATQRNKEPILNVLRRVLPPDAAVLEIASGTGEHAAHCAAAMPGWRWQPSDCRDERFASIRAWAAATPASTVLPPVLLDVTAPWPPLAADAIFCANMIHIAPWEATLGLLRGAAALLPAGGPLILYGPFHKDGAPTAPSNAEFDRSLRARDPAWGVRDLTAVAGEAAACGFRLEQEFPMPANNLMPVFRRV